jgi:glycosyltransferase involved in cell wall biosynthesis
MDNRFVFIIGSYNNEEWIRFNLDSILTQTHTNFIVIYYDACSTDKTGEIAQEYAIKDTRIKYHTSEERHLKTWFFEHANEFENIKDNDIICVLDGDDFLSNEDVLDYLNEVYNKCNCWVTYGGMVVWNGGDDVKDPFPQNSLPPQEVFDNKLYRQDMWRYSHMRTCRGFLWKRVNPIDFKSLHDGKYITLDDLATVYAFMEMSPANKVFRVTEPIYIWNNSKSNQSRGCEENKVDNIGAIYETEIRNRLKYPEISFVTPTLAGGLGNQMFEIAAAASLAKDNNAILLLDNTKHILPNQGRDVNNYTSNVFSGITLDNNIYPTSVYKRDVCTYEKIPFSPNLQTNGHFQSWRYFDHNREYIQKLFDLPKSIKNNIIGHEWDYPDYRRRTAIQVRRGDYHKFPDHHPLLPIKYFHETIESIDPDGIIWIFTDDKEWCEKNFKPNHRMHKYIQEEDYVEMYMMSFCKNLIISNSSFGWWAAYLNVREDKQIYVPDPWFGKALINEGFNMDDLILPEWNRIKI